MDDFRSSSITRRKFLAVLSVATLPLAACGRRRPSVPVTARPGDYFWSGIGFGIEMSMEIYGVTAEDGDRLGMACEQCIRELEQAFSLYQEDSELSVLNRKRMLARPSPLFRKLLGLATDLHARTLGYYQPAVHGAWSWLERRGSTSGLEEDSAWHEQLAACDLKFVEAGPAGSIRLLHPLAMLSMNAIGQGFLADTVASRLRSEGVDSALLQLGESYAIGRHPEGRWWNLAVTGTPVDGEPDIVGHVRFSDAGLAVSAQDATRVLIDPVAGGVRQAATVVAVVSGEGAAVADAYATAFAVAPEDQWPLLARTLAVKPGSQVRIWIENQLGFTAG